MTFVFSPQSSRRSRSRRRISHFVLSPLIVVGRILALCPVTVTLAYTFCFLSPLPFPSYLFPHLLNISLFLISHISLSLFHSLLHDGRQQLYRVLLFVLEHFYLQQLLHEEDVLTTHSKEVNLEASISCSSYIRMQNVELSGLLS